MNKVILSILLVNATSVYADTSDLVLTCSGRQETYTLNTKTYDASDKVNDNVTIGFQFRNQKVRDLTCGEWSKESIRCGRNPEFVLVAFQTKVWPKESNSGSMLGINRVTGTFFYTQVMYLEEGRLTYSSTTGTCTKASGKPKF